MADVISDVDDAVDRLHDQVLDIESGRTRTELTREWMTGRAPQGLVAGPYTTAGRRRQQATPRHPGLGLSFVGCPTGFKISTARPQIQLIGA